MSDGRVFVYGTLLFDEVVEAVTGRRLEGAPAVLEGFARRRIRERNYPGIVPDADERTAGRLYRDVDTDSLARLDVFEGELYDRLSLEVDCGGHRLRAFTYVVAERYRHRLSEESWDPDDFMLEHGEAFVAQCRRWREQGVD